nr:hypothetical protein [Pseudomonadota bacterium]
MQQNEGILDRDSHELTLILMDYLKNGQISEFFVLLDHNPSLAFKRENAMGVSLASKAVTYGEVAVLDYLLGLPQAHNEITTFDLLYYIPKENVDEINTRITEFFCKYGDTSGGVVTLEYFKIHFKDKNCTIDFTNINALIPGLANLDMYNAVNVDLVINCLSNLVSIYFDLNKCEYINAVIDNLEKIVKNCAELPDVQQRWHLNLITNWCLGMAKWLLAKNEFQHAFNLLSLAMKTTSPNRTFDRASKPLNIVMRQLFARKLCSWALNISKAMIESKEFYKL